MSKAEQLTELLRPAVASLGFDLWGVEYHSGSHPPLLRIYIDHAEGINVDDCGRVSDQVSAVLDVEEPIPGEYTLEVSSPGIERPLFSADQYRQYLGETIKVRLAWPEHGRRNFRGVLCAVTENDVDIEVEGSRFVLPLAAVARARLIDPERVED